MRVYSTNRGARERAAYNLFVRPANDMQGTPPSDFVDADKNPIQFTVTFEYGRAEVPDALGYYLLDNGHAQRTALILPA